VPYAALLGWYPSAVGVRFPTQPERIVRYFRVKSLDSSTGLDSVWSETVSLPKIVTLDLGTVSATKMPTLQETDEFPTTKTVWRTSSYKFSISVLSPTHNRITVQVPAFKKQLFFRLLK